MFGMTHTWKEEFIKGNVHYRDVAEKKVRNFIGLDG
jgi:hypothetical protein